MFKLPDIPDGSILGVNYSGMHDSAIAIVSPEGNTVFACSLERVSRVKQDGRPPHQLLEELPWSRIESIAVSTNREYVEDGYSPSVLHPLALTTPRREGFGLLHDPAFNEFFDALPKTKDYVCHHDSHAASAFWPSGFDSALCLTYDGGMANCPWFGGLYSGSLDGGIKPLDRFAASHYAKITSLYTFVTALLGFSPNKHEGKITGLAAIGEPSARCREALWDVFSNRYFAAESAIEWFFSYGEELSPELMVHDKRVQELEAPFAEMPKEEIAATVQVIAEEHVVSILERARELGWVDKNICLSGGLFANVKINQRIKSLGFENIFISPAMTDDGTALGSALHVIKSRTPSPKPSRTAHQYLGPSFDEQEIERAAKARGLEFDKPLNPAEAIADLLAAGKVVAVFQGAMEFGPRALGNRSILSQATDSEINRTLNNRLRRTEFMPFAPITREEDFAECYPDGSGCELAAEFMTITLDCSPLVVERCPAVVHVDGTARPQLVRRSVNPLVHDVLSCYREITGNPALINTSFNIHEEPIVCTPDDMIDGFLGSGIDYLYADGGYLFSYEENLLASLELLKDKMQHPSQKEARLRAIVGEMSERLTLSQQSERAKENVIRGLHDTCEERLHEINRLSTECIRLSAGRKGVSLIKNVETVDPVAQLELYKSVAESRLEVIEFQREQIKKLTDASFLSRSKGFLAPRLGRLFHHEPRPLRLPKSYRRVSKLRADAPKISIVTPSFNQHEFIERTILSVLDQNYPVLEYIVQDGASTDATVDILRKYEDRLTFWDSSKDAGQTNAINIGFKRTSGDLMAYLNSDDLLLPGALDYVASYFERHPEVDVVYGHRVLIDEYDQHLGSWILPRHDGEVLSWADYIPQETMFWRRSIWEKAGGSLDESFRFAMDWDLILRFREAGANFVRLPRFLGAFRIHPHQKTSAEITDAGYEDMRRLRERCHGRAVSDLEVRRNVLSYLIRHRLHDLVFSLRNFFVPKEPFRQE